jgi:sugar (pentulose or hexulose) kinase
MTFLVGVDCGTQSAKVVIYDHTGHPVAEGRQTLRPMHRPRHGVAVHPDDDIWTSIGAASTQAMQQFEQRYPGRSGDIAAVGICPIRCCKAFLDADGALLEPVMSWMDERAYAPYVPADPALRYATTLSGYVAHRFTGRFADTAANNIEGQWPIDAQRWDWSADPAALATHGLTRDLLVELQLPGEVIGALTADAARTTGLPCGIPVVATANDKAVEMLGAGNLGPSTALVSLGTYIAAMIHGDTYRPSPAAFWTNFAAIPHRYLYESNGVRRGMWTLTWFLDLLGPEFAAAAQANGLTREQVVEREATGVPPGSDGLLTVLDWLAPADAAFRKGSMLGFDARHTRGHVYRSILEAITLTMKHHVDRMTAELGVTLTDIVVSGGGSTSALFMQLFADVFGVPARRSTHGGAALGSAMCAAAAVGLYPSIEAAAESMAAEREVFTPNADSGALYHEIIQRVYLDIRAATDPVYERSFPLFH